MHNPEFQFDHTELRIKAVYLLGREQTYVDGIF